MAYISHRFLQKIKIGNQSPHLICICTTQPVSNLTVLFGFPNETFSQKQAISQSHPNHFALMISANQSSDLIDNEDLNPRNSAYMNKHQSLRHYK